MRFSLQDLFVISNKALTLSERLSIDICIYENFQENSISNSYLFEKWCQIVAQGDWEKFEKRLIWDDIDLKRVNYAFSSCFVINKQHLPGWTATLNEYLEAASSFFVNKLVSDISEIDRCLVSQKPLAFEEILLPFVYLAKNKLKNQANSCYELLSAKAHISLERCLLKWLSDLCGPVMQLDFSIFRARKQSTVANLLEASNKNYSRIQYQNFIKNLLEGELLSFFREYPVLARLMVQMTDLWLDATKELLWRLASDWAEIEKTFNEGTELGQVISVQPFLSDRHQSGRSVTAVQFSSGLKLIYKPKEIGLEQAYFDLLGWLNEHNFPLPFKLLKVLNRSTYRWIEFVEPISCKDNEEVRRYYQRFGVLVCLAQVLGATDLHLQNIIACGEHPVLIDMETLMHPQIREEVNTKLPIAIETNLGWQVGNTMQKEKEDGRQGITMNSKFALNQLPHRNVWDLANQQLENSVLSTGLLPRWQFSSEKQSSDFSGLGGFGQHKTIFRVPKWFNVNTDNMQLSYKYAEIHQSANIPSLNGVNLPLNNYLEEIVDGFNQMYRFLIEHRQAILAPDAPLTKLAHQSVRFIFRPTTIYRLILEATLEPKFLRDGVEWSIQLDLLSRMMLSSDTQPQFWPILKAEKQALEQMDIPLFTARSDSADLTIAPNLTIENYFTEPSFNHVIARLNQLDEQDLEQQIYFIKGSLYSRTTEEAHPVSLSDEFNFTFNGFLPITQEEIVEQAIMVATSIDKQAIRSTDGGATWLAPQYLMEAQRFQIQPMGHNLFDGSFGVASFLAALTQVTPKIGFRDLGLGALQSFRQDLRTTLFADSLKEIGIGGAVGGGAIVYVLTRVSQFLEESTLLEDATQVASLISSDIVAADKYFNIISGTAGAILGLLALHTISPNSEILEKAILCGNHLLNNRVASESGYRTWATADGKLLTGFSHGAAGIAYALLRLYKASGETAFLEAAEEAIAYERSVFISEQGNWPDFRQSFPKDKPVCLCSWCHGATGIGLARLGGLDILDTPEIRQDIEAAINTTKQQKLTAIDHLCCGNMGRVEFLLTASRKLSRPELLEDAMQIASQVVARAQQKGHFGYGPILSFHPGFFQGASGIGYELLRLAYPDQLPSVLLWE
ncbi:hypothetical protein BV378_12215 [Nostoc sp. RF31YmG]|nr:hypothetical protein BV378_12215 [Nostoc sp. RF31YmG]